MEKVDKKRPVAVYLLGCEDVAGGSLQLPREPA